MSNKQSSVEYLIEHLLPKALTVEQYYHIEKAKAMHKEEIINARVDGDTNHTAIDVMRIDYAKEYYKERFENI